MSSFLKVLVCRSCGQVHGINTDGLNCEKCGGELEVKEADLPNQKEVRYGAKASTLATMD